MEVKVTIGFDKKAEILLERVLGIAAGAVTVIPEVSKVTSKKIREEIKKSAEDISGVEMAASAEEADEETENSKVNYDELRKKSKDLGIKLVKKKMQKDVKALTSSYGFDSIMEVSDEKIEAYYADLKKLDEEGE